MNPKYNDSRRSPPTEHGILGDYVKLLMTVNADMTGFGQFGNDCQLRSVSLAVCEKLDFNHFFIIR